MTRWIAGTLQLASKVRYGLTSRGVPLFRFIPYDSSIGPFAVGCQTRDLFYNIHAIVEPSEKEDSQKSASSLLPKANLVQTFGPCSIESEKQILLFTYAYNNCKEFRKYLPPQTLTTPDLSKYSTMPKDSYTFHIDPQGCKDVDDALTILPLSTDSYKVWIHITDVASWIPETSTFDKDAYLRSTSFYTPLGVCSAPMLAPYISENYASLLPSKDLKPAVSLSFIWKRGSGISDLNWSLSAIQCTASFTYDDTESFPVLEDICITLGATPGDSHTWIQSLMVLYNSYAGRILKDANLGILRKQSSSSKDKYLELVPFIQVHPELELLAHESAEFCLASESDTLHSALKTDAYAYCSSPLRRYVDLINQRILKHLLFNITTDYFGDSTLVSYLNLRQKQAKAYQRDYFFATSLALINSDVEGLVISGLDSKSKYRVYVPSWKRFIKVICLTEPPLIGSKVSITWYHDTSQIQWKNKIVFQIKE